MKHLQEPMPLLHPINPAIPPRVDEVIGKATAKRPQDRYHTAGELASDLRIAIEGIGLQSAPTVFAARHASTPPLLPQMPRTEEVPVLPSVRSIPSTPKTLPPHRGRMLMVWPLVVALILFAIVGGLLVPAVIFPRPPATPTPTSTPTPRADQEAQDAVVHYYENISKHDYSAAYLAWQNHPDAGYCNFVNGFWQTETDTVTFEGVPQQVDQSTYHVPITLHATEQFPEGVRESVYKGYQTMVLENGTWKIPDTAGSLPQVEHSSLTPPIPPAGTPSDQGQTVVQQFYDDVNRQDYPAAYFLWSRPQQVGYCDFVKGYARMNQDAVTFGTILPQSDGTVVVPVTVHATEETTSGTIETVYSGTYVVGQEQGLWKLQSGRLQKSS